MIQYYEIEWPELPSVVAQTLVYCTPYHHRRLTKQREDGEMLNTSADSYRTHQWTCAVILEATSHKFYMKEFKNGD